MQTIGIIVEYNPLHNGHIYQINKIRQMYNNCIIVIIVNNCFMQRGEISIVNPYYKTLTALEYVDLVVELPTMFGCQSSDTFASIAVELLAHLHIDILVFGSECNDIELLKKSSINLIKNDKLVKNYLSRGISYPKAISLLSNNINKPNDLLAISYIKSIIINNYSITPISIKRTNDYHGKDYITNNIISGTTIRTMYNNNEDIDKYLPTKDYLIKVNDQKIFTLLKYQILTNINCLAKFLSVDEGLDYRIKKNIYNSTNLEDLIAKVKTKRYTYNRLKRMFTHILLSLTKEEIKYNKKLEYIKILGFNEQGRKYLHSIKKEIKLPIIYGYQKNLSKSLDIDFRIKSIYSYIVNDTSIIENELNKKPIYKN